MLYTRDKMNDATGDNRPGCLGILVFALACIPPLLGVWLATSLAHRLDASVWLTLAVGALFFPVLPLLWEGVAAMRRDEDDTPWFDLSTRLGMRTVLINTLWVVGLAGAFPQQTFSSLALHGDWMLNGRHGEPYDTAREVLLTGVSGLEWLHHWVVDDPYDEHIVQREEVPPPAPLPTDDDVIPPSQLDEGPTPDATTETARPSDRHTAQRTPDDTTVQERGTRRRRRVSPPALGAVGRGHPRYPLTGSGHPALHRMRPSDHKSIASVARYLRREIPNSFERVRDPRLRGVQYHL